ncbi:hypothetical protein [Cohnella cholangitidis]|uniref:Uncharacterized protein n=1 Tax=Cohnella cholangitidis TaxID=2598458 RepID=A0A7G5C334_9BACL|nr:hypothetical protein [Cohnella cholangitidis]QMV43618.1 hypothetical protein FPL14_22390 [Cohnella cholangitidis]
MIRSLSLERATLNVTLSLMVKARRKSHALEMADFLLNENNVIMDRIRLVNEVGSDRLFLMERIDGIHWDTAQLTDYSNLFKAIGHIRMTLRTESYSEPLGNHAYRLPRSSLNDRTVWVIPTTNEPAFTQVISQSLEVCAKSPDSFPFTNAG